MGPDRVLSRTGEPRIIENAQASEKRYIAAMSLLSRYLLSAVFLLVSLPAASGEALEAPLFSVPLQLGVDGHVLVQAEVNDRWQLPMVVDTGAHVAVVPVQAVESLELSPWVINTAMVTTASAQQQMEDVLLQSIDVGRGRLERVPSLLADMPRLKGTDTIPGVLPSLFLQNFTVHFDLEKQRLEFFPADIDLNETLNLEAYSRLPFEHRNGFVLFTVMVNDTALQAVLDTGASGNPVVNWPAATLLGVEPSDPGLGRGRPVQGIASQALASSSYTFDTITIGDEPLPRARVDIAEMAHFQALVDGEPVMNLGLLPLREGSLYISYASKTLYVNLP